VRNSSGIFRWSPFTCTLGASPQALPWESLKSPKDQDTSSYLQPALAPLFLFEKWESQAVVTRPGFQVCPVSRVLSLSIVEMGLLPHSRALLR
jgi:hypothetical protein